MRRGGDTQPVVRRAGLQSSGTPGLSTWDSTSMDPVASGRSWLIIHGEGLQPAQPELLKTQIKGLFNRDPKVLCFLLFSQQLILTAPCIQCCIQSSVLKIHLWARKGCLPQGNSCPLLGTFKSVSPDLCAHFLYRNGIFFFF